MRSAVRVHRRRSRVVYSDSGSCRNMTHRTAPVERNDREFQAEILRQAGAIEGRGRGSP